MSRARRPPPAPGHGAAIARQMGLLPELGPAGDEEEEEEEGGAGLEAELLALLGGGPPAPGEKPQGTAPLPMEAIERMAALCMRDPQEEEEEEEDDEEDLMAELQEVLGDSGGGGGAAPMPPPTVRQTVPEPPPDPEGMERRLRERADMYRAAIGGAGGAGDGARLRRYQRGLKTLETLLADVKKGKKIQEEEIPPPVALGKGVSPPLPPPASSLPDAPQNLPRPPQNLPQPPPVGVASPETKPSPSSPCPPPGSGATEGLLRDRQRGYQLAALQAKRRGDLEAATKLYRVAKSLEPLLEAVGQGRPVGLSQVPPPPDPLPKEPLSPPAQPPPPPKKKNKPEPPPPPRDALEALQQRMERYRGAAEAAEARGDARKARMHQRIVTQYQAAIRAHKAGKTVDFSELPVPPGFQPIPGAEAPAGGGDLGGLLEAAAQLATQGDPREEEEEEEDGAEEAKQLLFLEGRRRRLLEAALGAKRRNDAEGAKLLLRQAKGLEPLLQAARSGLPVDIAK
ncbi:LOW QUALITY PROTEIN: coiled-coil and C2 domain-containing protein 1A-like, partial [Numenius arquata]|uniref:LOW QUALITY PROTEIN: coiled-coil and C2 domain-containing protein 1A-like n=1 Tax=Numenius arquata TaxID=31919 RepID=UPI003D3043F5